MKNFTFRMTVYQIKQLNQKALEEKTTVSSILRELVDEYLKSNA